LEQDAVLEQLTAAAQAGAAVLTANQRLSRTLRRLYDDAQARSGRRVWPDIAVLPMTSWLRGRWMEGVLCGAIEPRVLLASHQAEAVWRRIIEASAEASQLLDLRAVALSAMEAWQLVQSYRLPWTSGLYAAHDDWAAFLQWASCFRRECEDRNWIDESRTADVVGGAFASCSIAPPPRVLLAGFDEFTPQQQALLDALHSAGCAYASLPAPEPSIDLIRTPAANTIAELRLAARWARDLLLREPESRIGVVVPALSKLRARVEQIFTEVLHPERMGSPAADLPTAFHVSAGKALGFYPLVAVALETLDLGGAIIELDDAGRLLRSPFLAGASVEASSRALLDARLRRFRTADISFERLRRFAQQGDERWFSPQFAALLERCRRIRTELPRTQPPSAWAQSFNQALDAAGWPGQSALDSAEFQTVDRWKELVARFASIDIATGSWTRDEAVSRLRELAADTQFQPEDENAPVQIMGALEAAGARFDHLWITGLDDRAWPSPPHPHPFLPLALQRERDLPHSSAEREMTFARQTIARLKASAAHIVVSYPQREADYDLRPSALIADIRQAEAFLVSEADAWTLWMSQSVALEQAQDDCGPAVVGDLASGGVTILKRQAACPFRSFAELRLGARALDTGDLGIAPADRGTAAHRALQFLWAELQSHENLVRLTPDQLDAIAARSARRALERDFEKQGAFRSRFLAIEEDRLRQLLLDWLALERQRAEFTVIEREGERIVDIGGLSIRARIDRVDRLPDGREVVIDYKASAPSITAWSDTRPDEPQVPLYALSHSVPLAALVFGQLTPGELRFKGYAADADLLPGVKAFGRTPEGALYDSLGDRVEQWRPILEGLARDFRSGRAEIDPKRDEKTCELCSVGALCRVREWRRPDPAEDANGA
jgi:probable DNA repair protein